MHEGKCIDERLCVSRGLLGKAKYTCDEMKLMNPAIRQVVSETRQRNDSESEKRHAANQEMQVQADPNVYETVKPNTLGWDVELDIDLT